MKSRTEILVPLAAIQAVPIAVIAWYRLHRYAWYRYSAIVILYKRFSPSEQFGCVKGGTIHVIASLLAGAEVGTDQLSAPEHSFKREQQLGKIQEKRITHN